MPIPLHSPLPRFVVGVIAMLVVYWVYALAVVPIIEPTVPTAVASEHDFASPNFDESYMAVLQQMLPPDAWELDKPKILETGRGKILFRQYQPLPDGRLELSPCTVLVEQSSLGGRSERRPIIMRTPKRAVLEFDGGLDLARGSVGRFTGGLLEGRITIFSTESRPGKNDAMEIVTSNVQIKPNRIWTLHDVQFRFGDSFGRGSDLEISLAQKPGSDRSRVGIGRAESLELVHVEKVHLSMTGKGLFGEVEGASQKAEDSQATATQPTQVEVTCQGPFLFDFVRRTASFEDQVVVRRQSLVARPDELHCENLAIYFGQQSAAAWKIDRLVALGQPFMLEAPTHGAVAYGGRLEYRLATRQMVVEDQQQAILRLEHHELKSPRIEYQLHEKEPKRLGQLTASGPGSYRGRRQPGQWIDASWQTAVELRPDQDLHVLSMTGEAAIRMSDRGWFRAQQLHVWLQEIEKPPAPQNADSLTNNDRGFSRPEERAPEKVEYLIRPAKLLAMDQVAFNHSQLSGETNRLDADIRYGSQIVTPRDDAAAGGERRPRSANRMFERDPKAIADQKKFHVAAGAINLQLLDAGEGPELLGALLSQGVRLREIGGQGQQPPISMDGDQVTIETDTRGLANIDISGAPANVVAQGMTLRGNLLQLSQADNLMLVDGPGLMVLPPKTDQHGRALGDGVNVDWQGGMRFNGRTASFYRQIKASGSYPLEDGGQLKMTVWGDQLQVDLDKHIDFTKTKKPENVEADRLAFVGPVRAEGFTYDARGGQTSHDWMEVDDLELNHLSGSVRSQGPGWLRRVGFEDDTLKEGRPVAQPPQRDQLVFVHADFENGVTGNFRKREVRLHEQVRAVYGPVASWTDVLDAQRPETLGEEGILLNCDELVVSQRGSGASRESELKALGNVSVTGRRFEAEAARLSYSRKKSLITLAGEGRSLAKIQYRQPGATRPGRASAGKIHYSPRTGRLDVDDGNELNIFQ